MLDRNVRERISIHRSDYYQTLEELIEPGNIPVSYGGMCRCGDSGNCRFESPEELFMISRVEEINELTDAH